MRYRLDVQHYIHDRMLEPGHIIGDGTDVPMVNGDGSPMLPSTGMTPLDDEAADAMRKRYPGVRMPERDPTKAIPLRGTGDTAKSPPAFVEKEGRVVQPHGGTVETVDNVPGGYVIGPDGQPTKELKKGLPDSGSPNHPVGQPIIGSVTPTHDRPVVPAKPQDPDYAANPAQAKADQEAANKKAADDRAAAEAKAKADAAAKAQQTHPVKKD